MEGREAQSYREPRPQLPAWHTQQHPGLRLRVMLSLALDTHLAIHQDVEADPKYLEEVPVVGLVLHEVPGKP